MWIEEVAFRNFGPFKDKTFVFQRGLVGVVGPNGSGKSTLLDGIYVAITNDFRRFDGVKADCVSGTIAEGEESSVYAKFHHADRILQITRRLKGKPAHELSVDGGATITNSDKIAETIFAILGVNADMLDLFVFKRQDKIYDFMVATDAVRKDAFQTLCRTEGCEKLYDLVGEVLARDAELNAEVVDNSDELTQEVATLDARDDELKAEAATWEAMLLNEKSRKFAQELLAKDQRFSDLCAQRDDTEGVLVALRGAAAEALAAKKKALAVGEAAKAAYEAATPGALAAAAALKGWQAYARKRAHLDKLQAEAKALTQEAKKHKKPDEPPDWFDGFDRDEAAADRTRRSALLARAGEVVAAFAAGDKVECPTCGTPVRNLAAYIKEQKELLKSLPAGIDALEARLEQYDGIVADREEYAAWKFKHDTKVKTLADALIAAEDPDEPEGDREEFKRLVAEYAELESALETSRKRYQRAAEAAATAAATLAAREARLAEILTGVTDNDVPADKVERAKSRMAEHTTASNKLSAIAGQRAELARSRERLALELSRLRARIKRGRRLRQMAFTLRRVRDVMHRNGLPNLVAQTNLSMMEGDVNAGLELFGDPFWVESTPSLQFMAHKPGEPPQSAGRLSTGQKVVLAVSFWLAVASLWKSEIGMLALDEPTANLDEDNRSFLAAAMMQLAGRARGQRQVIMVTHADNLRSSFDQTIDLGV